MAYPDKDPSLAIGQACRIQAGRLERLPPHFQEQAVLRVDPSCFDRHDLKEHGIKGFYLFQKTAPPGMHFPWRAWGWIIEGMAVPPVCGHLCNGVHPTC